MARRARSAEGLRTSAGGAATRATETDRWGASAARIKAMEDWSAKELASRVPADRPLLYPFAGPDALHAIALFGHVKRLHDRTRGPRRAPRSEPAAGSGAPPASAPRADLHRLGLLPHPGDGLRLLAVGRCCRPSSAMIVRMGGKILPFTAGASTGRTRRENAAHRLRGRGSRGIRASGPDAARGRYPHGPRRMSDARQAGMYLLGESRFSSVPAPDAPRRGERDHRQDDTGIPHQAFRREVGDALPRRVRAAPRRHADRAQGPQECPRASRGGRPTAWELAIRAGREGVPSSSRPLREATGEATRVPRASLGLLVVARGPVGQGWLTRHTERSPHELLHRHRAGHARVERAARSGGHRRQEARARRRLLVQRCGGRARTASFGYAKAVVLRDGLIAEGTGGGACQVASTLYAAALSRRSDQRPASRARPSAYIPRRLRRDGVVSISLIEAREHARGRVIIRARAPEREPSTWRSRARPSCPWSSRARSSTACRSPARSSTTRRSGRRGPLHRLRDSGYRVSRPELTTPMACSMTTFAPTTIRPCRRWLGVAPG